MMVGNIISEDEIFEVNEINHVVDFNEVRIPQFGKQKRNDIGYILRQQI